MIVIILQFSLAFLCYISKINDCIILTATIFTFGFIHFVDFISNYCMYKILMIFLNGEIYTIYQSKVFDNNRSYLFSKY